MVYRIPNQDPGAHGRHGGPGPTFDARISTRTALIPVTAEGGKNLRIGLDGSKFPDTEALGPLKTISAARDIGAEGVFFRTVLSMSPTLDRGELREIRAHADGLGMYLESGLGKVNPYALPESPEIRAIGDGDTRLGFQRMIEACAEIDCRELWAGTAGIKNFAGRFAYDRFRTDAPWPDQLRATAQFLSLIAPVARDHGVHINLETHEEITSFELLRLIDAVGDDVVGLVFDTANLMQRAENPASVVNRIAPYVRQTHITDAALTFTNGGVLYQSRPVGGGAVDLPRIVAELRAVVPQVNLTVENPKPRLDTVRSYPFAQPRRLEIFDAQWQAGHPDLSAAGLADFVEIVTACESRMRAGDIPSIEQYQSVPFSHDDAIEFITAAMAYLARLIQPPQ